MEHAVVRGDVRMLDDPLRAQSLSLIVAVILADFGLMTAVAGKTDVRNEEIRAMLQSFIGRMGSVAPSGWGGVARSMKLHAALQRIAETIRYSEPCEAGESHSHQISSDATNR
jgi:uncharacterized protein YukE